jgi:hypothetical protein
LLVAVLRVLRVMNTVFGTPPELFELVPEVFVQPLHRLAQRFFAFLALHINDPRAICSGGLATGKDTTKRAASD